MTVPRTHLLLVVACLSGCKLYSLQDGCGPGYDGGDTCVVPTTGGTGSIGGMTSGGTATAGLTGSGSTGGMNCGAAGLPCASTSVVAVGAKDSADLTWTSAFGNGSPVTGYIVTSSPAGGPGALNLGAVTAAVFPSLTAGTSYTFSVVALNANGQGPAAVSNAVVPFDVPGAASNIVLVPGQSQVVLSWTAAPGNGLPITGYTVTASPGSAAAVSDGGDTTATVAGLLDNATYTFSVVASNDAGIGPPAISGPATPFAVVTTLAGNGTPGYVDGSGGITGMAEFSYPTGVAVDSQLNVYVADSNNSTIRKVAPDGTTSTFAGNGASGYVEGTGTAAAFNYPYGVAVDPQGFVYVADSANNRIRKITPGGATSTLAGNGMYGNVDGTGGPTGTAQFSDPMGVAVDSQGTVYVADTGNDTIRKITPDGTTTTLAGNGDGGYADGPPTQAAFYDPWGIAVDAQGNVYVADVINYRIRKVAPDGTTSTLAGNGSMCDAGGYLAGCYADGTGGPSGTAAFNYPIGVAVDDQGYVYVADTTNLRIRRIAASDGTTTTLAGNAFTCDGGGFTTGCYTDGTGGPDGGTASFSYPYAVGADPDGGLYVADTNNQRIRKINQ